MDKYEYKVRSDEIKSLIGQGNYAQAAEIADTIDWRRVKSVMMLCTVSDVYKINRRYEDAKNMLLLAYERRPGGRTICYSLCELCIKTEEFVQALNYFKEFTQVAPRDTGRYILQYKLYEAQEVSLEERIGVLEELKKRDYREKWAYELAYLYHRVGLGTRCVEECDELILWFGEGKYVVKAMELKMLHQPLTPAQQEVYDHRFEEPGEEMEPEYQEGYGEEAVYGEEPMEGQEGDYGWPSEDGRLEEEMQEALPQDGVPGQGAGEELDIQVKTMDVGQYNTINLQAELAAGLQEVLGADGTAHGAQAAGEPGRGDARMAGMPEDGGYQNFTEEEIEDSEVFFGATGELEDASLELGGAGYGEAAAEGQGHAPEPGAAAGPGYRPGRPSAEGQGYSPEQGAAAGPGYRPRRSSAEGQGYSPEQAAAQGRYAPEQGTEGAQEAGTATAGRGEAHPERKAEAKGEQALPEGAAGEPEDVISGEGTPGQDMEQSTVPGGHSPEELAEVLSQEADGQISMVLPESATVEKQITGQMKIEDILAEWERIKKENEAKCQEEVRQHVLSQTGPMFTEFEATVRDGLLEQLEKGEAGQNGSKAAHGGPEENGAEQAAAGMAAGGPRRAEPKGEPGYISGEANPEGTGFREEQGYPEEQVCPETEGDAYTGEGGTKQAEEAGDVDETAATEAAAEYMGEPGYAGKGAYTGEPGYVGKGAYEGEPGYAKEGAYAGEPGYAEEAAYMGEPGYTEEGAYADEPGYAEEGAYEGEPGYAKEAVYTGEPGYAEEGAYVGEPGYAEEGAYAGEPGYAEEAAYMGEPGYAEEGAYAGEPGYAEEGAYVGEPGYAEEGAYAGEPGYAEEGAYAGEPGYAEEGAYVGEPGYAEEGAYAGEPGYAEEGAYEGEPGYAEGAAYAGEPGYAEEGAYAGEPGYAEEGAYEGEAVYADETEYIEEAGAEDAPETMEGEYGEAIYDEAADLEGSSEYTYAPDGTEPDDIIGEIEEIQEQIEKAEEREHPARTGRPKTGKTEKQTETDEKATIERDQAKVRSLTREEKELFAPFIQNRRSREQLVKALDSISMAAYTGNLIITGEEGMDTLTLAKNIMREVRMMDSNFSGKVAKVSGQGLNEKDVAQTLEQLGSGALIIQKASGMSPQTAAMLHRQLQHERFGIIVVLEDTGKAIKKLFLGTPDLYGDFTARIDLEALSNDSLVAFGRQYAREKEFSIDNLGILALHTRIEELQTIDHVVTVMEVKQIVDEAIRHASRKTLAHFFDVLLAKRYDDEDMIILTEKDFAA